MVMSPGGLDFTTSRIACVMSPLIASFATKYGLRLPRFTSGITTSAMTRPIVTGGSIGWLIRAVFMSLRRTFASRHYSERLAVLRPEVRVTLLDAVLRQDGQRREVVGVRIVGVPASDAYDALDVLATE